MSKAISRLEARTKTVLFHRTSRRVVPTETGLAALERASRILEEGEAVEAEITEQSGSLRGPIRMSAPMSFGLSRVAPALPGFMARYPDVTLDVDFNDEIVDLITNRFDLAVRISSFSDSSLLARRLCTVRLLLVGAPAYFEQYGRPRHPRDLAKHRALHYAYSHGGTNWHFRHPRQGEFSQAMPTPLNVNNAEGLIPALHAGLGLALQPEFLAWEDLESGILESVMEDWQADPIVLHIVTPPGRNRPARVQELILYLMECFSGAPWAKMSGPA
ncbi:DNA-binding transcriptional LysR family regulator OS=Castellaniella defragrans OX=75697 GN=HNR28_003380 PE=3 SV=1 [Castellaniella defragrans]